MLGASLYQQRAQSGSGVAKGGGPPCVSPFYDANQPKKENNKTFNVIGNV